MSERLYRPFRVGEEVVDGMEVYWDGLDWRVHDADVIEEEPDNYVLIVNDCDYSKWVSRQVLHALGLLRIDNKETV